MKLSEKKSPSSSESSWISRENSAAEMVPVRRASEWTACAARTGGPLANRMAIAASPNARRHAATGFLIAFPTRRLVFIPRWDLSPSVIAHWLRFRLAVPGTIEEILPEYLGPVNWNLKILSPFRYRARPVEPPAEAPPVAGSIWSGLPEGIERP